MVFGCVRSKSSAPGTSAVTTWISLPPSRRKSSSKDTAVPPLVGKKSSVSIRNGVFAGAVIGASERLKTSSRHLSSVRSVCDRSVTATEDISDLEWRHRDAVKFPHEEIEVMPALVQEPVEVRLASYVG